MLVVCVVWRLQITGTVKGEINPATICSGVCRNQENKETFAGIIGVSYFLVSDVCKLCTTSADCL